jgi:PEP-CTERM motif-containing protein
MVAIAGPAHAVTGTFAIQVGTLPPVAAWGSGNGFTGGGGGVATIPAGMFSFGTTAPINPPLLVINGFGIGGPGQLGGTLPLAPGTNQALAWNGVTGTMGLSLSAYLITGFGLPPTTATPTPTNIAAAIPLAIVGVGGNQKFTALGGLIMGTIMANPYQLGMVTVMGALNGEVSTLMGTGFDNRAQSTYNLGTLQIVSPVVISLGALGSLPALATLTLVYDPEPTTILLVGIGLVGLGAMRRRYST